MFCDPIPIPNKAIAILNDQAKTSYVADATCFARTIQNLCFGAPMRELQGKSGGSASHHLQGNPDSAWIALVPNA
jgi:hypothetical protein